MPDPASLLSLAEISKATGIPARTLRWWGSRGELPWKVVRLGDGRRARVYVSRRSFLRWIATLELDSEPPKRQRKAIARELRRRILENHDNDQ